jgi:hypothetical protein
VYGCGSVGLNAACDFLAPLLLGVLPRHCQLCQEYLLLRPCATPKMQCIEDTERRPMMLIFTNRHLASGTTEAALGRNFTPGGIQLAVASVAAGGKGGWKLSDLDEEVSEEDALNLLLPLFSGNKPLVLLCSWQQQHAGQYTLQV